MDTIELRGLTFRVGIRHDDSLGAPWDEHDGHGPVRVSAEDSGDGRFKKPGERVLHVEGRTAWVYDWQGATALAKKDGWGLGPDQLAELTSKLGRAPTPGEIREAAVQADFDYCRGYLVGDWHWCGVVVTLLDVDGDATRETESLWGIESSADKHLAETARELATEIAKRLRNRKWLETRVRVRP